MIRSYPESRFLCIGTGAASAVVVAQSLLMWGAQLDTATIGSITIDTLHRIATVVVYPIVDHCSEAIGSLGHVALADSAEVLGAINLEVERSQ